MRAIHLLLLGLLTLTAASTAAAQPVKAAEGGGPDLIEALRAGGARILSLGYRGGLDGYFVTPAEGAGYSLYLTGEGHAVAGLLYGRDGREITGVQLAAARSDGTPAGAAGPGRTATDAGGTAVAHAAVDEAGMPPPPPLPASRAALFGRSATAFGFTLGERGPLAVLFGDAACRWSRAAAARLGREALAGRLRLRVVPVAILGADAARLAAGVAASPDPALAWFEDARHPADRRGAEKIARNNALFDAWGADAVPLIVWRTREGAVGMRVGDVDDVGAWLRETLGPETLGPETLGPETLGPETLGPEAGLE